MSTDKPKELYDAGEAASYIGISRSYFDTHWRQHLPIVDMKAPGQSSSMWRWKKADLDTLIEQRRRDPRAA